MSRLAELEPDPAKRQRIEAFLIASAVSLRGMFERDRSGSMPTEKTRSDAQTVFPNLRSSQSEAKSRKPPPQSPLPLAYP